MFQPLDGAEPSAEIDLPVHAGTEIVPEQVIPILPVIVFFFAHFELLGLHPEEGCCVKEGTARELEVELPAPLEFREEAVGNLDNIDVPGIYLPPLRKT